MKPSRELVRELAAHAHDRVARQRLDRRVERVEPGPLATSRASSAPVTALSAPTEKLPTRPVSFAAPRIVVFAGCVANPLVGRADVAMRRPADPARIEQAGAAAVVAVQVEREVAGTFDEERPPLGEERFEATEVDDRRDRLRPGRNPD